MKTQINEIKRMQQLAGILKENLELTENYRFNVGDTATLKAGDVDLGNEVKILKQVKNFASIPKKEIGFYDVDEAAYTEEELNAPFYKGEFGGDTAWFSESEFN